MIVVADDRDMFSFKDMEELNNGTIEAEDVFAGIFEAYDLQGNLLKLTTNIEEKKNRIFKFEFSTYSGTHDVFVERVSESSHDSDKLKSHLLYYFKAYCHLDVEANTALSILLEKFFDENKK